MEKYNYNDTINLDYCRASSGKRLANYIIDLIVFYLILFAIYICIGILLPGILDGINGLLDRLITLVCYGFIMCLIEAVSHGKSIGKLITGTKAVNSDGSEIDFGKAFSRNMVRAIPFNAFSALSSPCDPWHDRWSDTIVVDEKIWAIEQQNFHFPPEDPFKNQTV